MANSIALFKKYVPLLDEVYKNAATTSVLDSDPSTAREGANTNEIIVQKLDMSGLGDYDRNSGYVNGDVTLTNETVKFNYERGRMFQVDTMDNEETAGLAYGRLAGEFIRTKVVPEIDAVRYATYASVSGITLVQADLADGEAVLKAILAGTSDMDEDEVPQENRHLFITPTLLNSVKALDTTKSREALEGFASIQRVPQSRFYTAVELLDGKTEDEEAGGYKKADNAVEINFMIIHKPAILQFTKHVAPKVITPEQNQNADAWKFGYRIYGLNDTYENKLAGIYAHTKAPKA